MNVVEATYIWLLIGTSCASLTRNKSSQLLVDVSNLKNGKEASEVQQDNYSYVSFYIKVFVAHRTKIVGRHFCFYYIPRYNISASSGPGANSSQMGIYVTGYLFIYTAYTEKTSIPFPFKLNGIRS